MVGVGKVNRECLCGGIDFDRVKIDRSDGAPYVTAFVECRRCRVMYHSPVVPDAPPPPPYTGPLILGRKHIEPGPTDEALMAAVRRANKGKPRGYR